MLLFETFGAFQAAYKTSQPSDKAKIAKTSSETLLRGDYLLLQKCSTELENMALPNHLQLTLFVPLPLPAPGSAPAIDFRPRVVHTPDTTCPLVVFKNKTSCSFLNSFKFVITILCMGRSYGLPIHNIFGTNDPRMYLFIKILPRFPIVSSTSN